MNTTQTQLGDDQPSKNNLPTNADYKTLVMLENQSHIDHMMGLISETQHRVIFTSWEKITTSLARLNAQLDENPIELGNGTIIYARLTRDENQ